MASTNLKAYEFQLEQVERKLKDDPNNSLLLGLQKNILQMITLTNKISEKHVPKPVEVKALKYEPSVGELCEAKYEAKWYEATVQSISKETGMCTVIFTDSSEASHLSISDIRRIGQNALMNRPIQEKIDKRVSNVPTSNNPQKKKKTTKSDYLQKKDEEQTAKQSDWQQFAKKMGINRK